jgi:hypothetical protein
MGIKIMDMDSAAYFLSGSILTMLGFIIIAMGIVAINNIFAYYWQPVKFFLYNNYNPTFVTEEEYKNRCCLFKTLLWNVCGFIFLFLFIWLCPCID